MITSEMWHNIHELSVKSQKLRLEMVLHCLATCVNLNVNSLCSIKHYAKQDAEGVMEELHTSLNTALDGGRWYASSPC